ncbi:hypothetical protein H7097_02160 [Aeromicrobium sp.]|nr:hypothetical protein [Candidatus Saccharibacteria bacterium]
MNITPESHAASSTPQLSELSGDKRLGHKLFEIGAAGINSDMLHLASVELSGGLDAHFLEPAADSRDGMRHDRFEADPGTAPYPFADRPATTKLLSSLTTFVRGLGTIEPDFAAQNDQGELVPHVGLSSWEPNHIELDRYTLGHLGVPTLPDDYAESQTDQTLTLLLALRGQRKVEVKTPERPDRDTRYSTLEPGKLLVVRAAGLLLNETVLNPLYRTQEVRGSNVIMIASHRPATGSVPAQITYDRGRIELAESSKVGRLSAVGMLWRRISNR